MDCSLYQFNSHSAQSCIRFDGISDESKIITMHARGKEADTFAEIAPVFVDVVGGCGVYSLRLPFCEGILRPYGVIKLGALVARLANSESGVSGKSRRPNKCSLKVSQVPGVISSDPNQTRSKAPKSLHIPFRNAS
ncbi:hypothetical protein CEXT_358091 [Caerostris extrusa]|uniref:Uncharacterized protein n=1 Tax=Caerostris extrusa TaxID=172846 RepID=A0AAV4XRI4_CAEEX|nr:hypothetical protein CEXT_358091 [Caerostris extrusa]